MLISDILFPHNRHNVAALSLATTGLQASDKLLGVYVKQYTMQKQGEQWVVVDQRTSRVLNSDVDPLALAQSQPYHGITAEQLERQGVSGHQFDNDVCRSVIDAQQSDILLIYNLDFMRRFLAKANAVIQPYTSTIDVTALDRLVRSGTGISRQGTEDIGVLQLAQACQRIGNGTLANMRKVHNKPTPDASTESVPDANCSFMLELLLSWLQVNIPIVS